MTTHEETRHERRERLQRRNDRNALITGLFGLLVVFFGLFIAGTTTNSAGESQPGAGLFIAALGAVAFGAGFYFRGRPVR